MCDISPVWVVLVIAVFIGLHEIIPLIGTYIIAPLVGRKFEEGDDAED
jgi:hypothetical protein